MDNMNVLILRYGELALKGKNRSIFENKLVGNIRDCLKMNNIEGIIKKVRGRIFVETTDSKASICLKSVFGLTSLSPAKRVEADIELIKKEALKQAKAKSKDFESFRVSANRGTKDFPLNSVQIEQDVGTYLFENMNKKVSLKKFDLEVNVEIFKEAFVFTEQIECFGGLPLGMTRKICCIVEDENSLLAAWLIMRRGCAIKLVSKEQKDISFLKKYSYGEELELNVFSNNKQIKQFLDENKFLALVSGQTISNLKKEDFDFGVNILRPLIAFDEHMISELKNKVDFL